MYPLGRVRLAGEQISTSSGMGETPAHLLALAQLDIPAVVTRDDDALNRIHALHVALEYEGLCNYGPFKETIVQGEVVSTTGGGVDYIKEMRDRRRENPSLAFLVIYDHKCRTKIYDLMCSDPEKFGDYSFTLWHVMRHYKHFAQEASALARNRVAFKNLGGLRALLLLARALARAARRQDCRRAEL